MRVLGIGEVLWDIFPDQELIGGAALNFCVNSHRLCNTANLITAVGNDLRGQKARHAMQALGLTTDFVQVVQGLPTGTATIAPGPDGEPHFTIPRPAAFDQIVPTPQIMKEIASLKIDWLYFGTLLQTEPAIERFTSAVAQFLPGVRCFYDLNLRPGQWDFPLIQRLSHMASVVKFNKREAEILSELAGISRDQFSLETFCPAWAAAYDIDVVCVTLGAEGCFVYQDGASHRIEGHPVTVCDTVGSGDAFAAGFLHGHHRGWPISQTARFANALGALVASRAGAIPDWSMEECLMLSALDS